MASVGSPSRQGFPCPSLARPCAGAQHLPGEPGKARATSECPDQLGKLLGQAAECIYTLISSLAFIKHPLPAREDGDGGFQIPLPPSHSPSSSSFSSSPPTYGQSIQKWSGLDWKEGTQPIPSLPFLKHHVLEWRHL